MIFCFIILIAGPPTLKRRDKQNGEKCTFIVHVQLKKNVFENKKCFIVIMNID